MTEEDVVATDSIRKEVDRNVVEMLREQDGTVKVWQWWDILGFRSDMTLDVVKRRGVVDRDGVHLLDNTNRIDATSICARLAEKRVDSRERGGDAATLGGRVIKRARW